MTADLLVVGHIAKDVTGDGWRAGGSVYYDAAQACRLGLSVTAVTACAGDIDPRKLLPDVNWHVQPSPVTTTFENRYDGGHRVQQVLAAASKLDITQAEQHLTSDLALLAPLLDEIDAETCAAVARETRGLVAASLQGWLRKTSEDGSVQRAWPETRPWTGVDLVFLSDEDIGDISEQELSSLAPVVVLTRAAKGCSVWQKGIRHDLAALPAEEVDPTGAGDVFATSFLIEFARTSDVVVSARFATAAAALCVGGNGIETIGSRAEIEARLAREAALRR